MTFPEFLKSFHTGEGRSRRWAADQLCVPLTTYNFWCDGRPCRYEATIRKLIELIEKTLNQPIDNS